MTPFISVLLPTRGRPDRCEKAIQSLFETADSPDSFEILLRVDNDDPCEPQYLDLVNNYRHAYRIMGPRMLGYGSVPEFYNQLSEWSQLPWILFWNDDVIMEGKGWDTKVAVIPEHGYIVQQETHKLGGSTYFRVEGGPMPFIPRNCWKLYGEAKIPVPTDVGIDQLLRVQNGWKTHWLEGVGIWHQRDTEPELAEHRKL